MKIYRGQPQENISVNNITGENKADALNKRGVLTASTNSHQSVTRHTANGNEKQRALSGGETEDAISIIQTKKQTVKRMVQNTNEGIQLVGDRGLQKQ